MLEPSISHLSIASIMLDIDNPKVNSGHLYLRTVEIIQLVEGPPPPRPTTSPIDSSSIASSSYASSSDYGSELSSDHESQSLCSSYCSSVELLDSETSQHSADASDDGTFAIRMKRILAWRESSASAMGTLCSDASLKRKSGIPDEHADGDAHSHSSKRPRSLAAHPCPACDSFFPSRQSLRQHGLDADAHEACSVAVQYAFE